jgi:hypothetical protein
VSLKKNPVIFNSPADKSLDSARRLFNELMSSNNRGTRKYFGMTEGIHVDDRIPPSGSHPYATFYRGHGLSENRDTMLSPHFGTLFEICRDVVVYTRNWVIEAGPRFPEEINHVRVKRSDFIWERWVIASTPLRNRVKTVICLGRKNPDDPSSFETDDSTDDEDRDVETWEIVPVNKDDLFNGGFTFSNKKRNPTGLSYVYSPKARFVPGFINRREDEKDYIRNWNTLRLWRIEFATKMHLVWQNPITSTTKSYLEFYEEWFRENPDDLFDKFVEDERFVSRDFPELAEQMRMRVSALSEAPPGEPEDYILKELIAQSIRSKSIWRVGYSKPPPPCPVYTGTCILNSPSSSPTITIWLCQGMVA